jgi:hypothetical protein
MTIASTAMPYAAPSRTAATGFGRRPRIAIRRTDAQDPDDHRVRQVGDDPTEHRDEVEAAVEVVHTEDYAPDARAVG